VAEIGASFGLALHPGDAGDADALLEHADAAMYRVKRAPADRARARRGPAAELERALAADQLELFAQPIVEPASGRLAGAELLLRWNHPERGLLAAAEFLPGVARARVMPAITDHVIERALALRAELGVPLAVNLSLADLLDGALPDRLARTEGLEFEIDASVLRAAPDHATAALAATGVPIALEAGDAVSPGMAERLPLHRLKLDAGFAVGGGPRAVAIGAAIRALGAAYGAPVTATRVEDPTAISVLRDAGFAAVQGFAVAPPMPVAQLRDWAATAPAAR
jgi:EAL domain-containing protein (putative c-di-GMP-specific phosphodiesterase class I)